MALLRAPGLAPYQKGCRELAACPSEAGEGREKKHVRDCDKVRNRERN